MAIRIGFISPFWLPRYGGGEQYDYRMAKVLTEQGFQVFVFCGTAAKPGLDNGEFPVTRWVPDGDVQPVTWHKVTNAASSPPSQEIFKLYRFMDEAVDWAVSNELDVALVSNPLQQVSYHQARELYLQLQAHGIKVGATHFDLVPRIEKCLLQAYLSEGQNWESAALKISRQLVSLVRRNDRLHAYHHIGSPLFFSPDFILSCSDWSNRFVDPTSAVPSLVVHPLLDEQHWREDVHHPEGLDSRDVLIVNPQRRKGPYHMANLIQDAYSTWTFRILKGGWGNAFKQFLPQIQQFQATREKRLDIRDFVLDMREAYRAANVVFFPSYSEGYGMTAVEPMYAGTPVVSSNYPAIVEAVGDGASLLCPHRATREEWRNAVSEVLTNRPYWRSKSLARAEALAQRQEVEIRNLVGFLSGMV